LAFLLLSHRPFKIKTDGDRSRVRELGSVGSIGIFYSFFTLTLSNVVRLLMSQK